MKKIRIFLITFILIIFINTDALADSEVCRMSDGYLDTGIGGTGHEAKDNGNGIGGTGHKKQDDNKGIGGTGSQHNEAKTIFISGTIYAYGSICVNGIRVTYDDGTPVNDGQTKTNAHALQLGQVVQIVAQKHLGETSVRAQRINVVHVIEGQVTKIDKTNHTLTVMGDVVKVSRPLPAHIIRVGEGVRVSGYRNPAGDIVASHIIAQPKNVPDIVKGKVSQSINGQFFVGKTPVIGTDLSKGKDVTVQGTWDGKQLSIAKTVTSTDSIPRTATYASIEGYNTQNQTVDGYKVVGENIIGKRVIVSGNPDANGHITITQTKEVPQKNTKTHTTDMKHDGSNDDNSDNKSSSSNSSDRNENSGSSHSESHSDDSSKESEKSDNSGHGKDHNEQIKIEKSESRDDKEVLEKKEKTEKVEKTEKAEKNEKNEKVEKIEKTEKTEKIEKVEKVEKIEKIEKAEKVEKIEKIEKVDKVEKIEKEKIEKPEKLDKSGKG